MDFSKFMAQPNRIGWGVNMALAGAATICAIFTISAGAPWVQTDCQIGGASPSRRRLEFYTWSGCFGYPDYDKGKSGVNMQYFRTCYGYEEVEQEEILNMEGLATAFHGAGTLAAFAAIFDALLIILCGFYSGHYQHNQVTLEHRRHQYIVIALSSLSLLFSIISVALAGTNKASDENNYLQLDIFFCGGNGSRTIDNLAGAFDAMICHIVLIIFVLLGTIMPGFLGICHECTGANPAFAKSSKSDEES